MSEIRPLRSLFKPGQCLGLPGVFDGISACVAESLHFKALYMTGYGAVASALGVADAGTASYSEMLDRVRCIAGATSVPFIADGDTGYGGLLNVDRTVRGYAAAGASGIQLEDQEFPKKCGHTEFRRVIPADDAAQKIRVAADARPSREFLIVARTDARYAHGLDEALRRADMFLQAGADILFVESPESLEELRRVGETFRGALLVANMVEGGRTPYLSTDELAGMGFALAIFPATGFLAAAHALKTAYSHLREHGSSTGSAAPLMPFSEMNTLMGFPAVHEFERRHGKVDEHV
jgi:2-methylisocitrate lyase-like PEP mutase family enzyme